MYHGTKSSIKERLILSDQPDINFQERNAFVIEMSPVIHKFASVIVETFHGFSLVLYRHVMNVGQHFSRIDVIFDRYFDNSLKEQTRESIGSGTRLPL